MNQIIWLKPISTCLFWLTSSCTQIECHQCSPFPNWPYHRWHIMSNCLGLDSGRCRRTMCFVKCPNIVWYHFLAVCVFVALFLGFPPPSIGPMANWSRPNLRKNACLNWLLSSTVNRLLCANVDESIGVGISFIVEAKMN
jgi:hypothetical protein